MLTQATQSTAYFRWVWRAHSVVAKHLRVTLSYDEYVNRGHCNRKNKINKKRRRNNVAGVGKVVKSNERARGWGNR